MKNKFKLLSVCLAMMTSSLLTGCLNEEQTQAQAGGQLLPVKFVPVSKQDVTVELNLQGRTNALREAEV